MAGNNLGTARGKIDIDHTGLKNADLAIRSAGDSMLRTGTMMVGAFAAIVGEAAKFEKEMDFVQAITDATADEMKALEGVAIDLAKNSIYGPIELAQAFTELVKAGATAEQIIGGVGEAAVNLATAADVEIPFAGENLLNILNTFSLGAEDAARVTDLLAGAANASSVDLMDIVTTMRYAGPVAAAMGISLEDVNTALSVLGRVGIKGSTAGTSLRFAMTRLVPDTKKAKDAIRDLGLNIGEDGLVKEFSDAEGNLLGLADIMQVLQDKTAGMNDQAKIAAINDIFGVRAMPSVLALMEAGEEGFLELNEAINTTTAADVAAKRMDNLDGSIKRLKATLSAMFVEAGGPFQEMLKGWVDTLRDVLLFIDGLPGPVKTFVVGFIGALGAATVIAGAFLLTIGNIVRAVRVMMEIGRAFSVITGLMRGGAAASSAASAGPFLLNPWVLLAAAIIAVGVGLVILYRKWKPFRDFVNGFWDDIKNIWADTKAFFGDVADAIGNFFEGDLTKVWDSFWGAGFGGEGITTELGNIHGLFERLGVAVFQAWEWIKDFFGDLKDGIKDAVSGAAVDVINFFMDIPGAMGDALGSIGGTLANFGGQIKDALKKAGGAILEFAKDLPKNLGFAIGFLVGRFLRIWFYEIPRAVFLGLKSAVTHFVTFAVNMGTAMGKFLAEATVWAINLGLGIYSTLLNFLVQLPGIFINALQTVMTALLNFAAQALQWALTTGYQFLVNLALFIQQVPGMVLQAMVDTISFIVGKIGEFGGGGLDLGKSFFDGLWNAIKDLPSLVKELLGRVIAAFKDLVTTAFNAAKDFGGGLWGGFKKGVGINSPSYIEKAMFAMEDQADATLKHLNRSVKSMNGMTVGMNTRLPDGLSTPQYATSASAGAPTYTHNGPLIGAAEIRSEFDIELLANKLERRWTRQARGRGIKPNALVMK